MTTTQPRPAVLQKIPHDRHTVIEASAGTGKTYTLEHLVVDLILRSGARIDQILVVTFTEKATAEMRERVRRTIAALAFGDPPPQGDPGPDPWVIGERERLRLRESLARFDRAPISTIHAFCQRVLTEHAFDSQGLFELEQIDPRQAFGRAFRDELRQTLASDDPLAADLERALSEDSMDPDRLEQDLWSWFGERGTPMPPPEEVASDDSFHAAFVRLVHGLVPRIRGRLRDFKRERGQIDFDDMLLGVRDALRADEEGGLLRELRAGYRFALVDEFQDTDEVQWEIFRRVFFDSNDHTLFVIGDPKQAIYGFRGADVHTYLRAKDEMLGAGGTFVTLDDNYRSTEPLIDGYNRLLSDGYFSGGIAYRPVRCGRPEIQLSAPDGSVTPSLCLFHVVGRNKLHADGIRQALYDEVAREIARLVEGGYAYGAPGEERPLRHSDVHVLTRTEREARAVGESLRMHGIPRAFFRQEGLFWTDEARHVRDVLRAVLDPSDRSRRLRAWLTPFFGVSLEELDACRDAPASHPLIARLVRWRELADAHDYSGLVRDLVDQSGLVRRELLLEESERELTNYLHILEFLLERAHRTSRGLAELVAELDGFIAGRASPPGESGNVQRLESEAQAVQVLTMHKAKGLEAPVVFVLGGLTHFSTRGNEPRVYHVDGRRFAWIGSRPDHLKGPMKQEEREEDERLFYVAMTRAKARLYLPYFGAPPPGHSADGLETRYGRLGGFKVVNGRLGALLAQNLTSVEYRQVQAMAATGVTPSTDPGPPVPWEPAPELLLEPEDGRARFDALHRRHAGLLVTSYTRLKAGRDAAGTLAPPDGEEFLAESEDVPILEESELSGGASVGIFLHEVLEELSFDAVRRAPDVATWASTPDVRELFAISARRNGVSPAEVPAAQQMLFDALRAPVSSGPLRLQGGFASVERRVAEMGFLFPLPEDHHPPLGSVRPSADRSPFRVERGFVRGVVDLVFEHGGRVYFLDWKSDRLAEWSASAVERHVEERYDLQARLYALGVLRMLDVRTETQYEERFGGLLYCFLRGMGKGAGIHFERPPWGDVRGWEDELRTSGAPWGYPLRRRSTDARGAP